MDFWPPTKETFLQKIGVNVGGIRIPELPRVKAKGVSLVLIKIKDIHIQQTVS